MSHLIDIRSAVPDIKHSDGRTSTRLELSVNFIHFEKRQHKKISSRVTGVHLSLTDTTTAAMSGEST
jgi:hypothetical protein